MKILLAEDDQNISLITKLALENFGQHEVSLAVDGEMALEMAKSNEYELILLDRMMPKMSGLEVCRQYKLNREASTPIIFLSARCHDNDVKVFCELGLGFIPKPFDPTLLCQQINEIMEKEGTEYNQ